jgi:hypothetical protein
MLISKLSTCSGSLEPPCNPDRRRYAILFENLRELLYTPLGRTLKVALVHGVPWNQIDVRRQTVPFQRVRKLLSLHTEARFNYIASCQSGNAWSTGIYRCLVYRHM